jgi:hypothetical protein
MHVCFKSALGQAGSRFAQQTRVTPAHAMRQPVLLVPCCMQGFLQVLYGMLVMGQSG